MSGIFSKYPAPSRARYREKGRGRYKHWRGMIDRQILELLGRTWNPYRRGPKNVVFLHFEFCLYFWGPGPVPEASPGLGIEFPVKNDGFGCVFGCLGRARTTATAQKRPKKANFAYFLLFFGPGTGPRGFSRPCHRISRQKCRIWMRICRDIAIFVVFEKFCVFWKGFARFGKVLRMFCACFARFGSLTFKP